MGKFSKQEIVGLVIIFLILVGVSWPNFSLSLRRARDQVRRDDLGNIQAAIAEYYSDYGIYPASTPDGKMIVCKGDIKPQENGVSNPGEIAVNLIPCNWAKDSWVNLTPGVSKVYMRVLSGDPDTDKGVSYVYFSDGSRYQLFGALEGVDEPGYDQKLAQRGVACGTRVCNFGRSINVPMYMTIEEYNLQIYCAEHKKDLRCINRD